MKSPGLIFLAITTTILVLLAIFSSLGFPFPVIYYIMCIGQFLLIITVYKILTDDYKTDKTFDDFYEDHTMNENDS